MEGRRAKYSERERARGSRVRSRCASTCKRRDNLRKDCDSEATPEGPKLSRTDAQRSEGSTCLRGLQQVGNELLILAIFLHNTPVITE